MSTTVENLIAYGSESHSLDFKKLQYPIAKHYKKHELLKDIIAMANHPSNEDKYIIIGVEEKSGIASSLHHISELFDQANYQQYINSSIEPEINFEYKAFIYKNIQLAYFRVYANNNRPYLFKKEIRNAEDGTKVEYREGDGFVRKGTSTPKLIRADFDNIYRAKQQQQDRKNDLIIKAFCSYCQDSELASHNLKYLDISIENTSNQSIKLEVDIKIFQEKFLRTIIQSWKLKRLLLEEKQQKLSKNLFTSAYSFTIPEIPSMHVSTEEHQGYTLASLTRMRMQDAALNLPQKDISRNIFGRELIILPNPPENIRIEVIVRSDSFHEGILQQELIVKL